MTKMHWYNPTTGKMENADWPANDEQAIDMLSHHPDSDEFIEEYRKWCQTRGIVESLISTGQAFQIANSGEQPSSKGTGIYHRDSPSVGDSPGPMR